MQTLHNLYGEDPEVFERLSHAMKKPPRMAKSKAPQIERIATRFQAWQPSTTVSSHQIRRACSLLWRTLNMRLTLRSIAPQKLTK